ncbi:hypothetical protein ERJ75_001847200 [Trypanosoma vivax]|nr:hypothetical protein ERJ75_001847200 [Trypanosoma vivax]
MRREGNCGAFRLELGREVDDDLETVTAGADSLGLTPCGDVCRNADFGLSMRKSRLAVLVAENTQAMQPAHAGSGEDAAEKKVRRAAGEKRKTALCLRKALRNANEQATTAVVHVKGNGFLSCDPRLACGSLGCQGRLRGEAKRGGSARGWSGRVGVRTVRI